MSFTLRTVGWGKEDSSTVTLWNNNRDVVGVQAGDLVIIWADQNSTTQTPISASDGTSTFTPLSVIADGSSMSARLFYLLASVATGSPQYVVTFSAACPSKRMTVFVFSPSDNVEFDNQAVNWSVLGDSPTSGDFTVSGTDILVIGAQWNLNAYDSANERVNDIDVSASTLRYEGNTMWYRALTSGFVGDVSAYYPSGNVRWLCAGASFQIPGGVQPPVSGDIYEVKLGEPAIAGGTF